MAIPEPIFPRNASSRALVLLLLAASGAAPAAAADTPSFESFPAARHAGKTAPAADLASNPDAKRFKTRLNEGFAQGARFAGHYAVSTWGCGTDCQVIAIIDMESGRVVFGPDAELDFEFRLDSRLLIANSPSAVQRSMKSWHGCPGQENDWAATSHYYEWTGAEFRHVADVNACEAASSGRRIEQK